MVHNSVFTSSKYVVVADLKTAFHEPFVIDLHVKFHIPMHNIEDYDGAFFVITLMHRVNRVKK